MCPPQIRKIFVGSSVTWAQLNLMVSPHFPACSTCLLHLYSKLLSCVNYLLANTQSSLPSPTSLVLSSQMATEVTYGPRLQPLFCLTLIALVVQSQTGSTLRYLSPFKMPQQKHHDWILYTQQKHTFGCWKSEIMESVWLGFDENSHPRCRRLHFHCVLSLRKESSLMRLS